MRYLRLGAAWLLFVWILGAGDLSAQARVEKNAVPRHDSITPRPSRTCSAPGPLQKPNSAGPSTRSQASWRAICHLSLYVVGKQAVGGIGIGHLA